MGGMSYADQVRMFFDSDIVLGGHGTAMTNCMFLLPHSVLIECNPPFFYEMCFANIAFYRVLIISVLPPTSLCRRRTAELSVLTMTERLS